MEELPRVLRANVPINNKKMSKREAEKLVREVSRRGPVMLLIVQYRCTA